MTVSRHSLTLKVPVATAADNILKYYFWLFKENRASHYILTVCLCELSARQMIHMKCQALFSLKNKQEGQDSPVSLTWLPDKFRVNWLFGSREELQYRFSRWWPSWISNQKDFSYFWSISHLDISNEVTSQLAFWFRIKKVQNRFSALLLGQPSSISDQNDFSYIFLSTSHPDTSYQFSSQLAFLFKWNSK